MPGRADERPLTLICPPLVGRCTIPLGVHEFLVLVVVVLVFSFSISIHYLTNSKNETFLQ